MGKRVSKLHASPLVSLCKERKEFVKAARYCSYDLVTSFVVYLESLLELGNALNQYVEQELVIFDDFCALISLSDFDPSEEDSHLEIHSCDTDSDLDLQCDHFHNEEEEHTCKHHSAACMKNREKPRVESTRQQWSNMPSNNLRQCNHDNSHIHVAMSHEDLGHHEHDQNMSFRKRWETSQSGNWFPQHMNPNPFGDSMSFSYLNDRYLHHGTEPFPIADSPSYDAESQKHETEQNYSATVLSTPSPPQVSTWDFLYPFSMNYDVPYDYDHYVREVREREGIPDLEDENEQGSTVSSFNHKEMGSGMRHGSGNGTSNITKLNAREDVMSTKCKEPAVQGKITEKEIKHNLESKTSKAEETTAHICESLGVCRDATPVASGRMSLKEAILDIRNEFKYLFDCGKQFSSAFEVGKLSRNSKSTKIRAFASSVLGLITPSVQRFLCHSYMLHQPASRVRLLSNADMRSNQEHATFGDLSSTLEKLYIWEKKLYEEVKGEEKLRIRYDKQYKRLKELDCRGSEPDKIDDTLASIKLLHSEIKVAVASISAISREINELRDNKLLPELNILIEGLMKLWKVMSTCHQKQFKAITMAKSHVHMLDHHYKKKSSSKATLRLERVILKWGKGFNNFINTQKALVRHLNDWLLRCILLDPEETEDGSDPLLPSDTGAPPIFGVCNNWYHEIDKISETGVSKSVSNFASCLHQLYENLEEEQTLKVRVQHLLKNYQYKLQTFCKKNGIHSQYFVSFINMKASEDFVLAEIPLLNASDDNLATSRERLVEHRKRHQEVVKHVNDVASSFLQEGLTPIFEALGSFCMENLKVYEHLKLLNSGPMNK